MTGKPFKALSKALEDERDGNKGKFADRFEAAEEKVKTESDSGASERAPRPKVKKANPVKMVRDGFSMPQKDFELIEQASLRIVQLGLLSMSEASTKSLIVRAGLHALNNASDDEFKAAIDKTPPIRRGRKP